jgi:DNA-binding CsgD family transcriptional regulator
MMRLSENVRTVTSPEGGVILDLRRGKLFRLNPTGATILELLVRGYGEERITAEISERCGVAPARVSTDVRSFLNSLAGNGLLLGAEAD